MKTTVIFTVLSLVFSIFSGVFCIYHFIIALFGLKPAKCPEADKCEKKNKFSVVISARNEENVIARLVKSLKEQDYPEELLEIYVIADNCRDNTAAFAAKAGATVYERNDLSKATKGFALNFMFEKLFSDASFNSDAFLFFDADNVVEKNFVSEMNTALNNGTVMAQGYRDTTNPFDSWISGAYTVYFLFLMRFCFSARVNAGLSAFLGGTGFMIKADLLKHCGWNTKEISEDIEFSLYRIAEGTKIDFVQNAVFYDEQPTSFKDSWYQRHRWSTGLFRCIKTCFPSLIAGFKENKLTCFDGFMYLSSVPNVFIGFVAFVCSAMAIIFSGEYFWYGLSGMIVSLVLSVAVMHLAAAFILWLEKKDVKKYYKGILGFPLFLFTFMLVTAYAVLFPAKSWKAVRHSGSLKK